MANFDVAGEPESIMTIGDDRRFTGATNQIGFADDCWKTKAEGFGGTWGTPVLINVDDDHTELVIGVPYEIWDFNPDTGSIRWFCEALNVRSFCSSVVTDGKLIYGMGDQGSGSIAIKPGGKGDVTKTHVAWSGRYNNRIGTPVVTGGKLYFVSNRVLTCVDASTGARIYQGRLAGASSPASPATGILNFEFLFGSEDGFRHRR